MLGVCVNHSIAGMDQARLEAGEVRLLRELEQSGWQCCLLGFRDQQDFTDLPVAVDEEKVQIRPLSRWRHLGNLRVINYLLAFVRIPFALRKLTFLYLFVPSHITWLCALWARWLNLPYGLYVRGVWLDEQGRTPQRWLKVFQSARFLIVTGGAFQQRLRQFNPHVDNEVPLTALVETAGEKHCYHRPFRTLLYVGRLTPEKGTPTILAALARLREFGMELRLDIAGGGSQTEVEGLQRQIVALRLSAQVRLLGHVQGVQNLQSLFRGADAFVFPSRYREGFPRVLYEAMMMGLPIVTSPLPGTVGVLEHEVNSLMCAAEDEDALARALQRLSCDETLRAGLGERGAADWKTLKQSFMHSSHGEQLVHWLGKTGLNKTIGVDPR